MKLDAGDRRHIRWCWVAAALGSGNRAPGRRIGEACHPRQPLEVVVCVGLSELVVPVAKVHGESGESGDDAPG